MHQRFKSCGLGCEANEGELREFSPETLVVLEAKWEQKQLPDTDPVLTAVAAAFHHGFDMQVQRHGLFYFRPELGFTEEDSMAKYHIFQVQVRTAAGFHYVYIVLDELVLGAYLGRENMREVTTYRLRGVTNMTAIPRPEYSWFNRPESWSYWSKEPQDFNFGWISGKKN